MPSSTAPRPSSDTASAGEVRRWRRYLAEERAEAQTYRALAQRRSGEERDILLALAEAEARHEAHWAGLLGAAAARPGRVGLGTRLLGWLVRRFGSVFVLALVQRAESRSPYGSDAHATAAMAADEQIHAEVVRGLAARGRNRLSGTFRAAVFGANDGLVSNFALVLGIGATGASSTTILATGLAGLLAGALSMGAGEYVSVRSQRELLEAMAPDPQAREALPHLDLDANELSLVYRARGMSPEEADRRAAQALSGGHDHAGPPQHVEDQHEAIGTGMRAAVSSFAFFASGAAVPVLPFLFGAPGATPLLVAAILVGLALLLTGSVVGLLSGGGLFKRSLRQVAIGYGAAAVTYGLGLLFGGSVG